MTGLALALPLLKSLGDNKFPDKSVLRRKLGRTEEELSIIGFGGIMLNQKTQEFANDNIARAFDHGVNYFDVAPGYGSAQDRMGPALKPYRDKCFLACRSGNLWLIQIGWLFCPCTCHFGFISLRYVSGHETNEIASNAYYTGDPDR